MTDPTAPLIVTAVLEPALQRRFDDERRRLFPPGRTAVDAHVTMFHALPGAQLPLVRDVLEEKRRRPCPQIMVAGVRNLGRGAAYRLVSPELTALHEELANAWRHWLSAQDRQPFLPHVTVQNNVTSATARSTITALNSTFRPVTSAIGGLGLWRYLGGPWEPIATFTFQAAD